MLDSDLEGFEPNPNLQRPHLHAQTKAGQEDLTTTEEAVPGVPPSVRRDLPA